MCLPNWIGWRLRSMSLLLQQDRNSSFLVEYALKYVYDLLSAWYSDETHGAETHGAGTQGWQCGRAWCVITALHADVYRGVDTQRAVNVNLCIQWAKRKVDSNLEGLKDTSPAQMQFAVSWWNWLIYRIWSTNRFHEMDRLELMMQHWITWILTKVITDRVV